MSCPCIERRTERGGECQRTNFFDQEGNETVVDEDSIARLDDLNDVLVVDEKIVLRAFLDESFVSGDTNTHAILKVQFTVHALVTIASM